ncbi:pol poly [Paramuricea clavata]|uniref:TPA_exp: pol poly n=1 Tax=Paramuricea clavata TaxID=317549 RepID=A0A6S7JDA9_PARCT|nr:pol poly [Paramuricea clavata]
MWAVHIEIAHSLDAESFLCAFSIFVSRRGQPSDVYSDNGTDFTAAHSVLEEEFEKLRAKSSQSTITDRLRKQYIQWHFNSHAASHMGGIWERLIRSIRRILKALLQGQRVNDESLVTSMAETERILNDRPLTRQEDHPNDLEPLTPKSYFSCDQSNHLLSEERQKWLTVKRNLQPKDLVLLLDERLCREQWPLGIVEEVYPDKNGRVRQVLVRPSKSKFKRDIRKLCLLEGDC